MKIALWFAALTFSLFAAMHIFITYEHWHEVGPNRESVVGPALTALIAAGVAAWCFFRITRYKRIA